MPTRCLSQTLRRVGKRKTNPSRRGPNLRHLEAQHLTSPRPRLTAPLHRDEGSVLAAGLPAGAFVATALVTLIYHFGQLATPQTLAGYIAKSAPDRFLEKADPEAYQAYADKLKATLLTLFNEDERSRLAARRERCQHKC